MEKEIKFTIKESKTTVEQSIRQYFLNAGCYEMNTKSGLKFKKEKANFTKAAFHPERLEFAIEIQFNNASHGTEVIACIKLLKPVWTWLTINFGYFQETLIDKKYFAEFLNHFKRSMEQTEQSKFLIPIQEKELKDYSKIYDKVIIFGYLMAIIFGFIFKSLSVSLILFLAGIIIHLFAIKICNNFWLTQKKKRRYIVGER